MAIRRRRKSKSLAAQTFELALAAPQVIAHRVTSRDPKEFQRMGMEKIAAVNEAWAAMATQAFVENQKFALRFMQSLWFPWIRPTPTSRQLNRAAARTLEKGLAPVRRRAVANAKRLGRVRRK